MARGNWLTELPRRGDQPADIGWAARRAAIANSPGLADSIGAMDELADMMLAVITEAYVRQREAIIREQQTIRELSTPVLRVNRDVLVAPVVGVFDTVRAEQLT
jgi:hypothetical protein